MDRAEGRAGKATRKLAVSDLKLFQLGRMGVVPLAGGSVALEKSLRDIFEKNLETLLGVRFLASELVTEGGRMDSIGIDEKWQSSDRGI